MTVGDQLLIAEVSIIDATAFQVDVRTTSRSQGLSSTTMAGAGTLDCFLLVPIPL